MDYDPTRSVLVVAVTVLLVSGALLAQWRLSRQYRGLSCWGLGLILNLAGVLAVPYGLPFADLACALLPVLGLALFYVGILRFFSLLERSGRLLAFLGCYGLVEAYWFFVGYSGFAVEALPHFTMAALSLLIGHVLLAHRLRPVGRLALFLALMFFVNAAVNVAYATPALDSLPFFETSTSQTVLASLWGFGFVLLVNQRLDAENKEFQCGVEAIFNTSSDAMLISRLADGRIVEINDSFAALTGHSRGDVEGKTTLQLKLWKFPEDRQKVLASLAKTGFLQNREAVFRRKDGSEFVSVFSARCLSLNDVPHLISVVRDITENKATEAMVRQLANRYAKLLATTSDGFWRVDANTGLLLEVNEAAVRMLGYSQEELLGMRVPDLDIEHGDAQFLARNAELLRQGGGLFETRHRTKDGRILDIEVSATPDLETDSFVALLRDITSRKQVEAALRESKEKYRILFAESPDAYLIVRDGLFIACNRSAELLLRGGRAQILGRSVLDFSPEYQADGRASSVVAEECIALALSLGKHSFEWVSRRLDGTDFTVEVSLAEISFDGKSAMLNTWRDISERKRLEHELRQREETYRVLMERLTLAAKVAHFGVWDWSLADGVTFCDDTMFDIYGLERMATAMPYQLWLDMVHPDDRALTWESLESVRRGTLRESIEFRIIRPDHSVLHIASVESPVFNEKGEVVRIVGVNIDITERKRAEFALKQSEEQLRNLFHNSPIGIFQSVPKGNLLKVNPALAQMLGYATPEDLVAGISDLGHQIYVDPMLRPAIMKEMMATEDWLHYTDVLWRKKDNSLITVEISGRRVTDADGEVAYLEGFVVDISERKRAVDALHETNAYLENLIDHANAPIIVWDPHFHITRFNHAFESLTGYGEAEVVGQSLEWLFPPGLASQSMALIGKTLSGERWEAVEIKIMHRDGSVRTVLWNSATLFAADGLTPIATIAQGQDITERKCLEDELRLQATTDELTGVSNRRHFIVLAQNELRRSARSGQPVAIALIDLDFFKQINDTHGHAAGDLALIDLATVVRKNVREIDVFCRFGGDEFALLLPATSCQGAYEVLERLRLALLTSSIKHEGRQFTYTISVGVACSTGGAYSFDDLLGRADEALYYAKQAGRNKVEMANIEA